MRQATNGRAAWRRMLARAATLRRQYGWIRSAWITLAHLGVRVSGLSVLVCAHKRVGPAGVSNGRVLTTAELAVASQSPGLDLPSAFLDVMQGAQCYGVVEDGQVRSYAWAASGPIRAVPGTIVRMSPQATYVFKAFTHPSFRRRGLMGECLKAIEHAAAREGRREVTALVEIHNRPSLGAFARAGFERCGFVVILRCPWLVKRVGCQCEDPCQWSPVPGAVPRISALTQQ